MEQVNKGMEFFLAGWILALATNYLGGLDTGLWIPFLVVSIEVVSLILMYWGVRKFSDLHKNFKKALYVLALSLACALGLGVLLAMSALDMSVWISITAICLTLIGDILFLALTGLIFLGTIELGLYDEDGKTKTSLGYRWALFLTFGILYVLIQSLAVLLANENLPALTYLVPVMGLPMLATGIMIAAQVYRIKPLQPQK
jgi:hypothetical protein